MNEDQQEDAWRKGWRPANYQDETDADRAFLREHPGWLQAAWAHPRYVEWLLARENAAATSATAGASDALTRTDPAR